MGSNIQPHISISEVFFHPLERLDSSQKKKLACITVACGILIPIIGGVFAFFATSAIFKNRNIKRLQEQDTPVGPIASEVLLQQSANKTPVAPAAEPLERPGEPIHEPTVNPVANAVLQPGKPIIVSPQCKDLLDCFGMRPDTQNQFDSNKLKDLIQKIYDNTPSEIFDNPDKTGLEESPEKLEAFLQRVNDYNLTLFVPVPRTWNTQDPPSKEEIIKYAEFIRGEITKGPIPRKGHITSPHKITCIPQEMFKCTDLTSLLILSSTLIGVSSKIGDLINLTELSISNSSFISEIPPEIGKLQKLNSLMLTRLSQLQTLPDEILSLSSLQGIALYNSGIKTLPKRFGSFKPFWCTGIQFSDI